VVGLLNRQDAKEIRFIHRWTQMNTDEEFFAARLSAAEGGNIQINLRSSASICG